MHAVIKIIKQLLLAFQCYISGHLLSFLDVIEHNAVVVAA